MKSLREYIIDEKLHLNKDIKINDLEKIKIDIPKAEYGSLDESYKIWKTIEFPKKKYVIYDDPYRNNKMHFAGLGDLIGEFIFFQDDYEDWDPTKKIYYASDNLKEILKWYFEKLELPLEAFDKEDYTDAYEMIKFNVDKNVTVDSTEFFTRAAIGEWAEDEIAKDYVFSENDMKDKKSVKAWFEKNF